MQIRHEAIAVLTDARDIITLPEPVTQLLDSLTRIHDERTALVAPAEPTNHMAAITSGSTAADSLGTQADYERAAAQYRDQLRAYDEAAFQITTDTVYRRLIEHGDDIIAGPIREWTDKMLDRARPKVDQIERFAPHFDAKVIVETATANELKAWQALIEPNRQLHVLIELWWIINSNLTARVGIKGRYLAADHLHSEIGGGAIWANPDACTTDEARGRWQSRSVRFLLRPQTARLDIWTIASQPEAAGFRLGTVPELAARFNEVRSEEAALEGYTAKPLPTPVKG